MCLCKLCVHGAQNERSAHNIVFLATMAVAMPTNRESLLPGCLIGVVIFLKKAPREKELLRIY